MHRCYRRRRRPATLLPHATLLPLPLLRAQVQEREFEAVLLHRRVRVTDIASHFTGGSRQETQDVAQRRLLQQERSYRRKVTCHTSTWAHVCSVCITPPAAPWWYRYFARARELVFAPRRRAGSPDALMLPWRWCVAYCVRSWQVREAGQALHSHGAQGALHKVWPLDASTPCIAMGVAVLELQAEVWRAAAGDRSDRDRFTVESWALRTTRPQLELCPLVGSLVRLQLQPQLQPQREVSNSALSAPVPCDCVLVLCDWVLQYAVGGVPNTPEQQERYVREWARQLREQARVPLLLNV
jgi:hypothetical protein